MVRFTFILVSLCAFLAAAENKGTLLYDIKKMDGVPFSEPKLPLRVYITWDEPVKDWVYALTDSSGEFKRPAEFLYSGTVVPGAVFGESSETHYKLNQKGKWLRTMEKVQYLVWVQSNPKQLKVFNQLPKSGFNLAKVPLPAKK